MEKEFQNLLRLIKEAQRGKDYGCSPTMIAFIKMATATTFELSKHGANGVDRDKLEAACNYSYQFCFRQKKWRYVVTFMAQFWEGVKDGFFEREWKLRNKFYDLGYEFGSFGEGMSGGTP